MIVDHMTRLRRSRGWSAERLGQEMAKAGVPWDRDIVTNLEIGRRRSVGFDEWLILAKVLGVAPLHLLVPLDDDAEFPVTADLALPAAVARDWITGTDPDDLLGDDDSWWHLHRPFSRRGTAAAGGAAGGTARVVRARKTTARPDPRKDS